MSKTYRNEVNDRRSAPVRCNAPAQDRNGLVRQTKAFKAREDRRLDQEYYREEFAEFGINTRCCY